MLSVHNSLSGKLEPFKPLKVGVVKMYHCGPTVYGTQHIGNLSMYVFTDILRRALESEGFDIKQVINFTDFGHLTSDGDSGEDKMSVGLKNEGLEPTLENMHKLGHKYAEEFLEDIKKLNIKTEGTHFPYASHYVPQQIKLIESLEKKGYTYKTSDGIYFDISQFPEYGKLGNIQHDEAQESRVGQNSEKKNQRDFALWKFGDKGWESPWGVGFPGWHIECSAMILDLLGEQIDIHTGGIEHIPVHHNNEIAQSESATGKAPFSSYWLHRAHVQIDGRKIAKSEGNVVYLSEIIEKGYSPLALRYLFLLSHYRTPTNFTWEALDAAQNAYRKIKEFAGKKSESGIVNDEYKNKFMSAIENDFNTPEALAVVWNLIKDESVFPSTKRATIFEFDKVLGLDLENNEFDIKDMPEDIQKLINEREGVRANKDFKKSDELRDEIKNKGFIVEDSPTGPKISRS